MIFMSTTLPGSPLTYFGTFFLGWNGLIDSFPFHSTISVPSTRIFGPVFRKVEWIGFDPGDSLGATIVLILYKGLKQDWANRAKTRSFLSERLCEFNSQRHSPSMKETKLWSRNHMLYSDRTCTS